MGLRKIIYLTLFAHGVLGISTESDKNVAKKAGLMPSTTSGKTSSVLREILNQESLVRFSMVQKIQKLVMDVIDNRDSAQNVQKRLQEAIKDLQTLESKEQDLEIKNANFSQKLIALNEAMITNKYMSTEETAHTNLLITELRSKLDDYSIRLKVIEGSLGRLFVSVNETLVDTNENNKNINMQLKDILDNQKNYSMQLRDINKKENNYSTQLRDIREDQMNLSTQMRNIREIQKNHSLQLSEMPSLNLSVLYPVDCLEIMVQGEKTSGIYRIYPWNTSTYKEVLCDMDTMGGGWTVIQHRDRENPEVNFNTTWDEYKKGFGDVRGNYWLGNDVIHKLTTTFRNDLYIRMKKTNNQSFEVKYASFSISAENEGYRLSLGTKIGSITDAFRTYNVVGHPFHTYDRDTTRKCARQHGSGWWYDYCTQTNLNILFSSNRTVTFVWYPLINYGIHLSKSDMLIRRH